MVPAPSYADILAMLNEPRPGNKFGQQLCIPAHNKVVGLLFFSGNIDHPDAKNIVANVDVLNAQSGSHIQFLMAGLSRYDGYKLLFNLAGADIFFDADRFEALKDEIEAKVKRWRYDYGADLLLLDIVGDVPNRRLNFEDAIHFKLDELVKAGLCDSASQVLDRVIRLARELDPFSAKDVTNHFQQSLGINWFKGLLLKMFPDAMQKLARIQAVLGGGRALAQGR